MQFEKPKLEDVEIELADSGTSSNIILVVLPGIEGAKAWKHQYRYFKTDFRTLVIDPAKRDFENYLESVKTVLNKLNLGNCILVGANLSCFIIDQIKDSGRVISSVFTDTRKKNFRINKAAYKTAVSITDHPKILKKLAFFEKTSYSTVKQFKQDLDLMDWNELKTYRDLEITGGAANALLVQPRQSKYSSAGIREVLEPDVGVSSISSGSFCFYEKPEEYNKALYDFISKLEDFQKKAEVREKRESNRSLTDFEKRNSQRKTRKVKK